MPYQYLRKASLLVDPAQGNVALDLSQMHFYFLVKRGDLATPNEVTIRVYNLSDTTVQKLQNAPTSEFSRVVLQVGYEGLIPDQPYLGTIFEGNIKNVKTGYESATDSFIEIQAADGDSAYNYASVNVSLAAGCTPNDVIDACLIAMGQVTPPVAAGYIPDYSVMKSARGVVLQGPVRDVLTDVARTVGASWSIQDGQLQLVPDGSTLPGQAVVLNSATGLIGFPQQTTAGIQVRSLINPKLKINSVIQIDNKYIQGLHYSLALGAYTSSSTTNAQLPEAIRTNADGFYRVLWVEHTGDTRGNEWYSDLICVAVDANYTNVTNPSILPDEAVYLQK